MEGKKSKGRQKVDTTKRREGERDRMVTFSKRKDGLYKKATELCTLCGPELAILISSPSGQLFSFGNPDFETVANNFQNDGNTFFGLRNEIADAGARARIVDLNATLTQVTNDLSSEEERRKGLKEMAKMHETKSLYGKDVDELCDEEAIELKAWLHDLMVKINHRVEELKSHDNNVGGFVDPNLASSSNGFRGI